MGILDYLRSPSFANALGATGATLSALDRGQAPNFAPFRAENQRIAQQQKLDEFRKALPGILPNATPQQMGILSEMLGMGGRPSGAAMQGILGQVFPEPQSMTDFQRIYGMLPEDKRDDFVQIEAGLMPRAQAPDQVEARSAIARINQDFRNGLMSAEERKAAIAKATQTSGGIAIDSNGDGVPDVTIGGPSKPFTEAQSKDNVFATRAAGALPTLNENAEALTSYFDQVLNADPTGAVRGNLQSPEYQVARAAADEFLGAILRKDTGAAITEKEYEIYGRTFLPQPGDSPEVIAYKQQARQRAIDAIEAGMSPSQILAKERALAKGGQEPQQPASGVEAISDEELMKALGLQ